MGIGTIKATETELVRYGLVAAESSFTVQAFSEGLLSAFGHDPIIAIREFSGDVEFVPGTFEDSSLRLIVNSDSLTVTHAPKEKDRLEIEQTMREQVLEVSKFPEIVFNSNNISANRIGEGRYRARIVGDLTLHGVTQKNIWISVEATVTGDKLRAQGEFSLKQSDFGIKPFSAVGGTIKLKNELKFSFAVVAHRQ